jgi:single-stranded-DNA-specific exonuclease
MMDNNYRWQVFPPVPDECEISKDKYPPLVRQILYNRGVKTQKEADVFMSVEKGDYYDSSLLPNIQQATSRIYSSLMMGDTIAVYGDFDVDGITASSVMYKGLKKLGADVMVYIPHRGDEGHGLNQQAISELISKNVKLIVTVDCGVSSYDEIDSFKKKVDFVVTDHHLPPEKLPPAVAIVDPYLPESQYPFKDICGAAVAFKVLSFLYRMIGKENEVWQFIDYAALGTIADVMPLLDENRYIVQRGIESLKHCTHPGINEIMRLSKIDKDKLDAEAVSWYIAPRLNAAGRMDHANKAFDLLTTDDLDAAAALAFEMEELNKERQKLTTAFCTIASDQVKDKVGKEYIMITGHPEIPTGIAGLVAGRLCDKYGLPAIIMHYDEEYAHGSARSVAGFDITEAMAKCSDILVQYGGHSQAGGFTVAMNKLDEFTARMSEFAREELEGADMRPTLSIDAVCDLREVDMGTFESISTLAPFGFCNQAPLFLSTNVRPQELRVMGTGEKHLKFKGIQGSVGREFVGWGYGPQSNEFNRPLDIVYTIEVNEWRGTKSINLIIKDLSYSSTL